MPGADVAGVPCRQGFGRFLEGFPVPQREGAGHQHDQRGHDDQDRSLSQRVEHGKAGQQRDEDPEAVAVDALLFDEGFGEVFVQPLVQGVAGQQAAQQLPAVADKLLAVLHLGGVAQHPLVVRVDAQARLQVGQGGAVVPETRAAIAAPR